MSLNANELIAAISYIVDLSPNSTRFHSWKVALVAKKIAKTAASQKSSRAKKMADELFYAGLLHEVGCVDSVDGNREDNVRSVGSQELGYPSQGSAILARIPELAAVSNWVRCHHESLDGTGYPAGLKNDAIPIEGQILALAEAVVLSSSLDEGNNMMQRLQSLVPLAGRVWPVDLWSFFWKHCRM